ncbi:MAG TPA: histidine phosphatase family protein [Anaerolineales bacterium]
MVDSPLYHITFLRHGESVGNLENRFQGHADFPLTETGRAQARALAERWQAEGRTFDRVFSSPLLRACETAEIICAALNMPLELDPDWMEINNGLLAGLSDSEAAQSVPRPAFITPYTHTGRTGESRWEVYLRAGRNVQKLVDHPARHTLVVAHGGILNMTLYTILGIPIQADSSGPRFMFHNTTFATFTYEPEHHNWRMLNFDYRPHWKED